VLTSKSHAPRRRRSRVVVILRGVNFSSRHLPQNLGTSAPRGEKRVVTLPRNIYICELWNVVQMRRHLRGTTCLGGG
jgi:hypothetical protein